MATATNTINIQHSAFTLTRQAGSTPDRNEFDAFDVPNADLGHRPKLFYRVSPDNDTGQDVELRWRLNGDDVDITTFSSDVGRSMHVIVDPASVLQAEGNELEARVISGNGRITISEVVFQYGVNL